MKLYDTSFENARTPLLDLIRMEKVGIDVAMWFMEDLRFSTALIDAHKRGVRVRVIMNKRDGVQKAPLLAMRTAGIPMRSTKSFFHPKAMIFAGQKTLEIGGANFTGDAFVPEVPFVNYTDEIVGVLNEPQYVQSAMREFDEDWINAFDFDDYGNAPNHTLQRAYPFYPRGGDTFLTEFQMIDRLLELIGLEQTAIHIIMYRATNSAVWHALHLARERGVKVRMIIEPNSYYKWAEQTYQQPWNMVQGIYYLNALGGEIKFRTHLGLTHEKFGLFFSTQRMLFGSQNWNVYEGGREWNVDVYNDPVAFDWGVNHFGRKWNSVKEFAPLASVIQL